MGTQIGTPAEARQHLLDTREDGGIVRVSAQKAQQFVQPAHLPCRAQTRGSQLLQKSQLADARRSAPLVTQPFERRQGGGRHQAANTVADTVSRRA